MATAPVVMTFHAGLIAAAHDATVADVVVTTIQDRVPVRDGSPDAHRVVDDRLDAARLRLGKVAPFLVNVPAIRPCVFQLGPGPGIGAEPESIRTSLERRQAGMSNVKIPFLYIGLTRHGIDRALTLSRGGRGGARAAGVVRPQKDPGFVGGRGELAVYAKVRHNRVAVATTHAGSRVLAEPGKLLAHVRDG